MIDRADPYEHRRRLRAYKGLRQPTPQQGEKGTSRHSISTPALGDTRDGHLRGQGNPFSAAHVAPRKK